MTKRALLCIAILCLCIAWAGCSRSSSDSSRQAHQMELLYRAVNAFRVKYGRYPADSPRATWFECLEDAGIVHRREFTFVKGQRIPVDVYSQPFVLVETANGQCVIRSIGRNATDDAGRYDDWDYPREPNWGHWYKDTWHLAFSLQILLIISSGIVLFRRKAVWMIGISLLLIVGSQICGQLADPRWITGRSKINGILSVALVLGTIEGIGFSIAGGYLWTVRWLWNRRARSRHRRGCCSYCAYDLRGLESYCCPECGRHVKDSPESQS